MLAFFIGLATFVNGISRDLPPWAFSNRRARQPGGVGHCRGTTAAEVQRFRPTEVRNPQTLFLPGSQGQ